MSVGMGMPSGWVGTHPSGVGMCRSGYSPPRYMEYYRYSPKASGTHPTVKFV